MAATATRVTGAVEGSVDEAVLRRALGEVGLGIETVYVTDGKANLRRRFPGFNEAAKRAPWVVLVDLDRDAECAAGLRSDLWPRPTAHLVLRVVVRAVEAWLLADAETMAEWLGIGVAKVPRDPEAIGDPKRALVDLAASARRRSLRDDLVPRPGGGRRVGPGYASAVAGFASDSWRPRVAAERAESLARALSRLEELGP